jgi:hypothetical protein
MRLSGVVASGLIFFTLVVHGEEPKKPETPAIKMIAPLGITPGVKARLTIRGLRLDAATEVRCQEPKAKTRLLKTSKVAVPNSQDPNRIGDTQVEAEVTLPPDYPNRTVTVTVVTPGGESQPHALLIDRSSILEEKEPNNGFRQAQAIPLPSEINGHIEASKDVDLYRFEGKADQKIIVEVLAARFGSTLDAFLTLYDADGHILASCDDLDGHSDPRLEITLSKDGVYFLGIIDANDEGGPTYPYRLSLRVKSP